MQDKTVTTQNDNALLTYVKGRLNNASLIYLLSIHFAQKIFHLILGTNS